MVREAEPQHEARQVARALETAHDADVAEALNAIDHAAAARVLAALPFDLAVRALNQPELDHRAHLFEHLPTEKMRALSPGSGSYVPSPKTGCSLRSAMKRCIQRSSEFGVRSCASTLTAWKP